METIKKYKDLILKYGKTRNFSKDLIKTCEEVFLTSIKNGDGAMWSDNFFQYIIRHQKDTKTTLSLNNQLGFRSNLLKQIDTQKTTFNQHLIISPKFRNLTDSLIINYNRHNPYKKLSTDDLILIELQSAIEEYSLENIGFEVYIREWLAPIKKEVKLKKNIKIRGITEGDFVRLIAKVVQIFILAAFTKIYPLDVFTKYDKKPNIKISRNRKILYFLAYIRDGLRIPEESLPLDVLSKVSVNWSEEKYTESIYYFEMGQRQIKEQKSSMSYKGHYITSLISKFEGSITQLYLDLLDNSKKEKTHWTNDDYLYLYLDNQKIKVLPVDTRGFTKMDFSKSVNNMYLGVTKPNPIWDHNVINNFEYLINKKNVKEKELQIFFELYPEFILNSLQISAIPQVALIENSKKRLFPDFVAQRANSKFIDIIEIKRPFKRLVRGTTERPSITSYLYECIAQLKEYKRWFENAQNRKKFRKMYGLEGFEPTLTLIIGRDNLFINERIKRRILGWHNDVNILTYDDLYNSYIQKTSRVFR